MRRFQSCSESFDIADMMMRMDAAFQQFGELSFQRHQISSRFWKAKKRLPGTKLPILCHHRKEGRPVLES